MQSEHSAHLKLKRQVSETVNEAEKDAAALKKWVWLVEYDTETMWQK